MDHGDARENITLKMIPCFLKSLDSERKIRRRLFTSSIKSEIRHFHVVAVQGRQRNVPKKCAKLFAHLNLLL